MNRNDIHFYACYWRGDLLPKLEFAATLCGYSLKAKQVTVDKPKVNCPQCLEIMNASNAITGIDWMKHPGHGMAKDVPHKAQPAPLATMTASGWSTVPSSPHVGTTEATTKPADSGWSTGKDAGWQTGPTKKGAHS